MDADRQRDSSTYSPSASEQTLDENDAEFIADCLAVIKGSAVPGSHDAKVWPKDARGETNPRVSASGSEHPLSSAARSNPAETDASQRLIRRLEAQIEKFREALTKSQAQTKESSKRLGENEVLRQSLARAREQRSATVKALEDLTRNESDARSEVEALHQALSANKADRDADISDLREARRREDQTRTELQTLREELNNLKVRYDETTTALEAATQREDQTRTELQTLREELNNLKVRYDETTTALEAATQRDSVVRAELATAMTVISDRDSAVKKLDQIITERNREIEELRQHLLKAEEARVADAAAILDSLNEYRT